MQKALDLRSSLLSRQTYSFSLDVTADFDETVFCFSVDCLAKPDGVQMTLTAPETISGIKAYCADDGPGVLFDDTRVSLGELAEGNLTPLEAPYLLRKAMEKEYIQCTGPDADRLRITYLLGYGDREITLDVWLDENTNVPVYAEFTYEGRSVVRADITSFQV